MRKRIQFKSITTITVLLLVVASLLVAGCTTNTTSNTNQTPTSSAATNDAFLEWYLAEYKNVSYANTNLSHKAWELTWINSTSARLEYTFFNKTANMSFNHLQTYIVFPTTQDATNYLNAMNKTAYSLISTQYISGGAYQKLTGHTPTVYKEYKWNEGNVNILSEYTAHEIAQLDNLIDIHTGKRVGYN